MQQQDYLEEMDAALTQLLHLFKEHVLAGGDMALLDSDGMEDVLKCDALTCKCNVLMDFSDLRILLTERAVGGAQL